jgi:toxin ParE1/3/4
MELRWTAAADDLEHIADYLFEKTPENAEKLTRKIFDAPPLLKTFPNRGRLGKMQGTRERVLPSLPYVVVYQVTGDVLYVVRILHGAQDWPR